MIGCTAGNKEHSRQETMTSPLADAVEELKAKGKRDERLFCIVDHSGRSLFLGQGLQQRQNAGWA
jgi:hypothetical protein